MENANTNSQIFGANFPKTADDRTYHVDTKRGEVANRIITVGCLQRAKTLAHTFFDQQIEGGEHIPQIFSHISSRGFATYTGTYKGVPITVLGTGMGYSMMDFSVRECAAIIDGPIAIIRIGTCGSIHSDIECGDVVVHNECVMLRRNPDAFRKHETNEKSKSEFKTVGTDEFAYYNISMPCKGDEKLTELLATNAEKYIGSFKLGVNATADSFYSSQGRTTDHFEDKNENLLEELKVVCPDLMTLEMESFHLFDLAELSKGKIHAASSCIVLAARLKDQFIEMDLKHKREKQLGLVAFNTLIEFSIDEKEIMNDENCVWHPKFIK